MFQNHYAPLNHYDFSVLWMWYSGGLFFSSWTRVNFSEVFQTYLNETLDSFGRMWISRPGWNLTRFLDYGTTISLFFL
ncbi:uncharacterized protein OCT59_017784 [Rhizophagus irregularis]|uniref:uncharacterized protein n=1 Tax=Rhizophagus irregularis TaxID=588596 RepID=UPI003321378B|nr:hypothetical protein OCT59_017784 [Rhizophagus irregularis]